MPSWIEITDESGQYINIDTNISPPQSTFLTIRYYNDFAGITTLTGDNQNYYMDFPVQITIKPALDIVTVDQSYDDLKSCQLNVFPLSYGSDDTGTYHINSNIFIMNDQGNNMLLSGTSKLYPTDDGNADGFLMRVTVLGFVQWITYLNSNF